MPNYSTVEIKVFCPSCGRFFEPPAGIISFQWGAIPERYNEGDAIRWLRDKDGSVCPPFRLYGDPDHLRWNFGDPSITNLLAFDVDPNLWEFECSHCRTVFPTAAVEIREGRIVSARTYSADDTRALFDRDPSELAIVEIGADGKFIVHDEWFDPPLEQA